MKKILLTANLLVSFTICFGFALSFGPALALAQSNRNDPDPIFTQPPNGYGTQILLGVADSILAKAIFPGASEYQKTIKAAKTELSNAEKMITSEEARREQISTLMNSRRSYNRFTVTNATADLSEPAAEELARLKALSVITETEKTTGVLAAQENLGRVRETALKAAQQVGLIEKGIRIARVGGAVLLIVDAASRVYVWNVLDRNPTLSPVGTYLLKQMGL